jgi:hypothetical protein
LRKTKNKKLEQRQKKQKEFWKRQGQILQQKAKTKQQQWFQTTISEENTELQNTQTKIQVKEQSMEKRTRKTKSRIIKKQARKWQSRRTTERKRKHKQALIDSKAIDKEKLTYKPIYLMENRLTTIKTSIASMAHEECMNSICF